MSDFFPQGFEIPEKAGSYAKFVKGENRLRILSKPLLGWEAWEDTADGGRKPLRRPMDTPFTSAEVSDPGSIKFFMAFEIYNYDQERVQILEITQKSIQRSLRALEKSKAWGSPLNYDLLVTRTGDGLETEYNVVPEPPSAIDPKIKKQQEAMKINLEALLTGEDPFAAANKEEETVNPEDVPDF